jgi:MltA-interacting protein MipA
LSTSLGVDFDRRAEKDAAHLRGLGDVDRSVYFVGERWIVSTGGSFAHLQGDAADSPIVQDDRYFTAEAAVLYRF